MFKFAVAGILASTTLPLRLPIYFFPFWLCLSTFLLFASTNNELFWKYFIFISTLYLVLILSFVSIYIARIYKKEQLLVGANGKLIDNKKSKEKLPFIFGEFSSSDFLIFKKKVEQSKFIFLDFKTFYFFPSNRWDILTNDNILIKLPQDNFLESLNLAYKIIKGNDFKNKKYIDLRIKNHLIIK